LTAANQALELKERAPMMIKSAENGFSKEIK
jgi:chromosome segregation protein